MGVLSLPNPSGITGVMLCYDKKLLNMSENDADSELDSASRTNPGQVACYKYFFELSRQLRRGHVYRSRNEHVSGTGVFPRGLESLSYVLVTVGVCTFTI